MNHLSLSIQWFRQLQMSEGEEVSINHYFTPVYYAKSGDIAMSCQMNRFNLRFLRFLDSRPYLTLTTCRNIIKQHELHFSSNSN